MPAPSPSSRAALLDHPLLREGRLWQAGSLGRCQSSTLSSGFAALDAELPGGGWPCQSLCEILQPKGQHAEWRLLAPGLRGLFASPAGRTQGARPPVLLIAPPFVPHGPGLQDLGLEAAHWVWIKPSPATEAPMGLGVPLEGAQRRWGRPPQETRPEARQEALQDALQEACRGSQAGPHQRAHQGTGQQPHQQPHQQPYRQPHEGPRSLAPQTGTSQEGRKAFAHGQPPARPLTKQQALHQTLWVAEQAIKSQAAGAVLVWLEGARPEQIRRLQAAALNSPAPIFLMRPDSEAAQSSAAPLRLRLSQPAASRGLAPGLLEVQLIKRRGPAMIQPLQLHSLPPRLQLSLPARLRQGVAPLQTPSPATEPAALREGPGRIPTQARSSAPEVQA